MIHDPIVLAPLRGVTVQGFRAVFARHFTGVDLAVAPFIPTVAGERIKPALLAEILPERNMAMPVIPQVIGRDPAQLVVMLDAIKALGYRCCDLNAGCPWPFVAKKGRGSGLLADEPAFAAMLETGCAAMPDGFSVKVRLGLKTPDLLEKRMALINRFPLREVVIHARTAAQMYEGTVDLDRFAAAAACCAHPVVYNGDLVAPADFARLKARFPKVDRWMVGRGLAINPFLAEMVRTGQDTREPHRLEAFVADICAEYAGTLYGDAGVLGRMKELWGYLSAGLADGERIWGQIKICRTMDEYRRTADGVFRRFRGFA